MKAAALNLRLWGIIWEPSNHNLVGIYLVSTAVGAPPQKYWISTYVDEV